MFDSRKTWRRKPLSRKGRATSREEFHERWADVIPERCARAGRDANRAGSAPWAYDASDDMKLSGEASPLRQRVLV